MPRINYLFIIIFSLLLATFATSYAYSSSETMDLHHYPPMRTGITVTNSLVNILSGRNLPTSPNLTPPNLTSAGIKVGSEPRSIAINPITNTIYVANYLSNTVSVLDGNNRDKVIAISELVNHLPASRLIPQETFCMSVTND